MPRKTNGPKIRLTLELNEQVKDRLEAIRARSHADSMTEVIRRALAVYDACWDAQDRGKSLFFKSVGGNDEERVLLL